MPKGTWNLWQTKWFVLTFIGIFLDVVTKLWAEQTFVEGQLATVIKNYLAFTLAFNTGAAFSFLSDAGGWQQHFFIGLAILVSFGISIWILRLPSDRKMEACGLSLILSGAIGNLIDRMAVGKVTDFILVHWWFEHFFPVFNVADILINIGVGLIILDLIRSTIRERNSI